jgi:transglutaminase-like putative cysteine protease
MPPTFRRVRARLELTASGPTDYQFGLAVSRRSGLAFAEEVLELRQDGVALDPVPLLDGDARLHRLLAGSGDLVADYRATVGGRAERSPFDVVDALRYLRPSRYCPSDSLMPFARENFGGRSGLELVRSVESWVHDRLDYRPEASTPTGGAEETLASGAGVCRDYAHLVITLLRAMDVPARLVAVYAPGLEPMDFHAVVETLVGDRWIVVDATRLAPRRHLLRIATGRDAADTSFLTNTLADIQLTGMQVSAELVDADGVVLDPGRDDPSEVVELG